MKKYILVVISVLLFMCGCDSIMNTPTKRVEEFLNNYQRQDAKVLEQLDSMINNENQDLNDEQKNAYKEVMKKQYKDLTYTIKEERIDGNNATVTVEIEVYDFNKTLTKAEEYYTAKPEEFKNEDGQTDLIKYMEYKIKELSSVKERIKYTLNLTLSKNNKEWVLNDITTTDRQKIHGLYNS